nr:alkylated DNA repair protein AlkB [Kwoniella shandongensis]KAA5527987.1 alkylated DNA repair protein AlkB [Kwoniella shandongensis]
MPSLPDTTHTAFRLTEKHFKNRSVKGQLPSLHEYQHNLVDLSRPDRPEHDEVWRAGWWSTNKSRKGKERDLGERPDLALQQPITLHDGRVGYLVAPGCILVPQYLNPQQQLTLLRSSLAQYTLPPNPLSLSTHYLLPPDLFHLYATEPDTLILPKHSLSPVSSTPLPPKSRTIVDTEPAAVLGYDEIVARNKTWTGDVPSDKLGAKSAQQLMREVRWANLGWVYQWSTKSYDFSHDEPIPFPPDLAKICSTAIASIPWEQVFDTYRGWETWPNDYAPDTGIVNFYQLNDTLMGHVDRSELDPARPLVSLSLGHAAILLLGSATRHNPPHPIILRSGDMLIMSGDGRQAYHGVPRIMEGTLPEHFQPHDDDDDTIRAAKQWISSARININARQVFPPGFQRPST